MLWKIAQEGEEAGGFLFKKLSQTKAKCNDCQQQIKLSNRGTSSLNAHLQKHPEYMKKFQDMKKDEESKKASMQQGLKSFVIRGKGKLSVLDQKIMHLIACENQPFTIVEGEPFKALLQPRDRGNLKGRHHYSDWVMPRVYAAVKKEVTICLNACDALSFTSDIWSGPTDSFISLTAHGIDSQWKRHKFVLCVRPFPGQHNFETIGKVIGQMLEDWGYEKDKQHVFLRDEGSNMKKVNIPVLSVAL